MTLKDHYITVIGYVAVQQAAYYFLLAVVIVSLYRLRHIDTYLTYMTAC